MKTLRSIGTLVVTLARRFFWGRLYRHIPADIKQQLLLRSDLYDRIGPIRLPLSVKQAKDPIEFTIYYFCFYGTGNQFLLMTPSPALSFTKPLLRISSMCMWAFILDSQRCDCRWELEHAKMQLANDPTQDSLLIFAIDQHGKSAPGGFRGHALIYALGQHQGVDLVARAYTQNGFRLDYRDYSEIVAILKGVGISSVRLLTNNPERVSALTNLGIDVEPIPIEKPYQPYDSEELGVKKLVLGHTLELPHFKPSDIRVYGLDEHRTFPPDISNDTPSQSR